MTPLRRLRFSIALKALFLSVLVVAVPSALSIPQPDRLYSKKSPFNLRIAPDAEVEARSPVMIQQLLAEAEANGWAIAVRRWTTPVYYAVRSTRRYDVRLTGRHYSGEALARVPIPESAEPDPTSDGSLAVIDRESGCEYDLWRAERNQAGGWSAQFANAIAIRSNGIYRYAESPRASGFASAAGLIWPKELRKGLIPHALVFTMWATKAGGPVRPATGSDGWSTAPGAIPEGARVQLDPALDLDALDLTPWQRTIAEALQDYGMFLSDTGGAFALQARHAQSAQEPYPWGDETYAYMPISLIEHLRVLKLGPQKRTVYRFVRTRCARLR